MARTYRINGTLALKPASDSFEQGAVIEMPCHARGIAVYKEQQCLFDADLTVTEILDNASGFNLFKNASDRLAAALVGTSAVTIFFFLSFISSM